MSAPKSGASSLDASSLDASGLDASGLDASGPTAPPTPRARSDKGSGRAVIGIRLSALFEIALFLVGALFIDIFFFDGTRFAQVEPHPFWVIVLLISVQYGTNEGIVAALASTAALLIENIPTQSLDQEFYSYLLAVGFNPVMWCTTAVVLGELRLRYARRERELRESLGDARDRETTIADAYQELMTAHERLEVSVASELNTVLTLYRASKRLQNLSPDDILSGAAEMVASVLQARKFSIFRLTEGRLRLVLRQGWTQSDGYVDTIAPEDPIFREVVGLQATLVKSVPSHAEVLDGHGVLAGPVVETTSGEILGMLKVEDMSFADLSFTTVENFKALCELISSALTNARRFETMASESMVAGPSLLLSDAYYSRQASFLVALARRLNFPVSLMRITVANAEAIDADTKARIPTLVRDCTVHMLRSTDLAFEFRTTQWEYVIVLPNTPMKDTRVVTEKFEAALAKGLRGTNVEFAVKAEPLVEPSADAPASGDGSSEASAEHAADGIGAVSDTEEYARQTQFLIALSRRAGFPVCGLRVTLYLTVELPEDVRQQLSQAVFAVVERTLTDADLSFNLDPLGQVIAVLMPGVTPADAQKRADAIKRAFAEKLGDLGRTVRAEIAVRELVAAQAAPGRRARRPDGLDGVSDYSPCRPLDPGAADVAGDGDEAATLLRFVQPDRDRAREAGGR